MDFTGQLFLIPSSKGTVGDRGRPWRPENWRIALTVAQSSARITDMRDGNDSGIPLNDIIRSEVGEPSNDVEASLSGIGASFDRLDDAFDRIEARFDTFEPTGIPLYSGGSGPFARRCHPFTLMTLATGLAPPITASDPANSSVGQPSIPRFRRDSLVYSPRIPGVGFDLTEPPKPDQLSARQPL